MKHTTFFRLIFCLALGVSPAVGAVSTLVPEGAGWAYSDTGVDLGTAWRESAYDDGSWTVGPAQLGYGDGDETTLIRSSPIYSCYYFRHAFTVADPAIYTALTLRVLRDDGCVVYLNGQEVARYNMPAGTITFGTWASTASEFAWDPAQNVPNLLVAGENVVAVEVHQASATSTDVSFDLELTATSEITLSLNAPAQGATGVSIPATLAATATDPQGENLTVSFYGRSAPPVEPDFSLVVLPDTQNYTAQMNGGTKQMFISQTDWIVNNRDASNIVYVAHLGDISNDGDFYESQWLNATNALYRLEPPLPLFPDGLPYGAAVGNHDQLVPSGDTEPTTYYNKYLGLLHYQNRSYYGGYYGNNYNNQYQIVSAGGLDFIVVYFEYDATPDQAVLTWANSVLQLHPTRRAIVVSHYLIGTSAAWGTQGQAIYNALKGNANLFLMLCGHMAGEARRADTYNGKTVHTLLADYQSYANGGNGYLRILEFSPANNLIRVKTYSPWLDQFETDASSQFTLDYTMSPSGPAYTLIQQNTAVASGTQTTALWTGLEQSTGYEWYVTATDGAETQSSEVRRFTTQANTPPTVSITAPPNGTLFNVGANILIEATASDSDGTVTQVEFFAGALLLGTDTESPYACTWPAVPAGVYSLTAVAHDDQGAQTTSVPVTITVCDPPAAPSGLTAVAQSLPQILLNWIDQSANETGFEIHQSTDAGQTYGLLGTVGADVTSALVVDLLPDTTYYYMVRAFNVAGSSDFSAPSSATTPSPPPPPAPPTALTATPRSTTEIDLAWTDNSDNETSFELERSLDGAAWSALATLPAETTSHLDAGLVSGTAYYYRIRASNAGGSSAWSGIAAAAPFVEAYATTETMVTGTLVGSADDTLVNDSVAEQLTERLAGGKPALRYSALEHKWTFQATPGQTVTFHVQAYQTVSSDGDSFVFAYSTDDVTFQNMVTVSATTDDNQYQVFALPNTLNGTVHVRLTDTDHAVTHTALDTVFVDHMFIRTDASPLITPPTAPVLQQALAGDATVTLTWSASAGATSYSIWRSTTSGSGYERTGSDVSSTSYVDSGLANGTTYYYVVEAQNNYGVSEPSNERSATPQAITVPEPPTNLAAVGGRKKIALTWTQSISANITQNKVYRSSDGGQFELRATIPAAVSYTDTVATGSTFYYRVTAVNGSGIESGPSGTASATAR